MVIMGPWGPSNDLMDRWSKNCAGEGDAAHTRIAPMSTTHPMTHQHRTNTQPATTASRYRAAHTQQAHESFIKRPPGPQPRSTAIITAAARSCQQAAISSLQCMHPGNARHLLWRIGQPGTPAATGRTCRLKNAKNCSGDLAPVLQRHSSLPQCTLGPNTRLDHNRHIQTRTRGKKGKAGPTTIRHYLERHKPRTENSVKLPGPPKIAPNTPTRCWGAGPAAEGCAAATTLNKAVQSLGSKATRPHTRPKLCKPLHTNDLALHQGIQDHTHNSTPPPGATAAGAGVQQLRPPTLWGLQSGHTEWAHASTIPPGVLPHVRLVSCCHTFDCAADTTGQLTCCRN